jgi:acetaldehyde dehydrogenase (acetylating)
MNKVKIAILGSGNIGTDLLMKVMRSPVLECGLFIGHNYSSKGMVKAVGLNAPVSDKSIEAIIENPDICEIIFDATSALDHVRHWDILKKIGKMVIDLTPSSIGKMCVPVINLNESLKEKNINVVTCGGQASTPLAYVIGQTHKDVEYIEVVSTIASRSAGPATRRNIDEYVEITEKAISTFSGCKKAKAILNLNPAKPDINMQTTVFALINNLNMNLLIQEITKMVDRVKQYVPGYSLVVPPVCGGGRVTITVRVQGSGDYLPKFAGNLDIVNCAALAFAEAWAKQRITEGKKSEQTTTRI